MKETIINAFNRFQITDLDHDMVGMCETLVNMIKVLRNEIPGEVFPDIEEPERFYKLEPHQPRMELRNNFRDILSYVVRDQKEDDFIVKIKNIYIVILAGTYIYHMPTEKMVEASLSNDLFSREDAKKMLLDDGMSPNWLKEPSGKDFTAYML